MSEVHQERVRQINDIEIQDSEKPVVYWMNRDMRIADNWALLYAQDHAQESRSPIIVVYNLVVNYLDGSERQWVFKLETLKELADTCADKNIGFAVVVDTTGNQTPKLIADFVNEHDARMLVTDFGPLRITREWNETIAKKVSVPFFEVDTHNIIPAWHVSDKQEFAAYTIRPKIHKLLPDFLTDIPTFRKHSVDPPKLPKINWSDLEKESKVSDKAPAIDWAHGGEKEGHKHMKDFIDDRLTDYALERNDPNKNSQSNLSPYLHYGVISAQRIAFETVERAGKPIEKIIDSQRNKAKVDKDSKLDVVDHAGAFLEELIVRRELSDNFCLYNKNYDNARGFPDWAIKSHQKHVSDEREYVYTKKQFEDAKTHDDLWNAAQMEMVKTGKMHGYMRMYWAKKILEWTENPDDAMEIAIELNDRYELDGRDPNGYAGIAWSIGGVHDRAWFERPIFGKIRYMNRNGCEKKFDVDQYIETWMK